MYRYIYVNISVYIHIHICIHTYIYLDLGYTFLLRASPPFFWPGGLLGPRLLPLCRLARELALLPARPPLAWNT